MPVGSSSQKSAKYTVLRSIFPRLLWLGVLFECALSGCSLELVPVIDCRFECNQGRCPEGLQCVDNFCVNPDAEATTCSLPQLPDLEPLARTCQSGSSLLSIQRGVPVPSCTGEDANIELRVTGGSPPYEWNWAKRVPGFSLSHDQSSVAYLEGHFDKAGRFEAEVTVKSEGNCVTLDVAFDVHETPRLVTAPLQACVSQSYQHSLAAEGGDPSSYQWSVEGLSEELEQQGGQIVGSTPAQPANLQLRVSLRDQYCPGDPRQAVQQQVPLDVKGRGDCPISILPLRLPAPCPGLPYKESLTVDDGSSDGYIWQLVGGQLPEGLNFDEATGVVSGQIINAAQPPQAFEVRVTDSDGNVAQQSYELSARDSCWLAYLSEDEAATRLHYRDVFLQQDIVLPTNSPAAGAGVRDFEFSPNGQWLAFRSGLAGFETVSFLSLNDGTETGAPARPPATVPVNFDCGDEAAQCGVLDYQWSPDSQQLAVILSGATPEQDYLSGVSVDSLETPWDALGQATIFFVPEVFDYHGGLEWLNNTLLAVNAGDPAFGTPDRDQVLLVEAPDPADMIGSVVLGRQLRLRRSSAGLLVFDSTLGVQALEVELPVSLASQSVSAHSGSSRVAPSGNFFSRTDANGMLQLYAFGEATEPVAQTPPGTCGVVIAWSRAAGSVERLACSDGTEESPNGQNLTIVDYDTDSSALTMRTVPTSNAYSPVPLAGTRRFFSGDGRWFIIHSSSSTAAIVDLSSATIVPPVNRLTFRSPAEMSFLPNSRAVSVYGADGLHRHPVPASSGLSAYLSNFSTQTPERFPSDLVLCTESPTEPTETWCGSPAVGNNFQWSRDSFSSLFEAAAGELWLSDVSGHYQPIPSALTASMPPCVAPCSHLAYKFLP